MSEGRFRDTSDFLPQWNPQYRGSKKNNNLVKLTATDKSWIIGWYLGSREGKIGEDKVTVHKMRAVEVGNPEDLSKPITDSVRGMDVEFFGTGVINTKLAEDIQIGQSCKIQWLGLTEPKGGQNSRNKPYHNWKLWEDLETAPITVQQGVVTSDVESSDQEIATEMPPVKPTSTMTDDDLPF